MSATGIVSPPWRMSAKPIETAPKDGRQILAVFPGKSAPIRFVCIRWHEEKWLVAKNDYNIMNCSRATHWMPLPAPPDCAPVPHYVGNREN